MRIPIFIVFSVLTLVMAPPMAFAELVEDGVTIYMTKNGFEPSEVTITQGDVVYFENIDDTDRWPASNIHPTHSIYSEFDPKVPIEPGAIWGFEFSRAGSWKMHDHIYPRFTGEITVTENPDFVEPPQTKEKSKILEKFITGFKTKLSRILYLLIPGYLQQDIETLDYYAVVNSEEDLIHWMNIIGPQKIMEGLSEQSEDSTVFDCHTQAHYVGQAAYKTLNMSIPLNGDHCYAGFYHGLMESFIAEKGAGNLKADIDEFCSSTDAYFGPFQCYHGAGHGLLGLESYDMPKALEHCGAFDTEFKSSSCYGGLFMENVMVGTDPNKASGHETQWLSDDPHFPCNAIGDDYYMRYQCYLMQTSQMLTLHGYDFGIVAELCTEAQTDMIAPCFVSLGRDIAGVADREPQGVLELCAIVPDENDNYASCLVGAAHVMIDYIGAERAEEVNPFCEAAKEIGKEACFEVVQTRLGT